MTLNEYYITFMEEVRNDSVIVGNTPANVFFEKMVERLESMEYIFNPTHLSFYKSGTGQRIMKFDAYAFDDVDKSFALLANEFIDDDDPVPFSERDILQVATRMLNYIEETHNGTIFKYADPSADAFGLAKDVYNRLKIDYVDLDNDIPIDRIKLFVLTNRKLSKKVTNIVMDEFHGRRVELNVWDIERIFDVVSSGREKEPIIIDFEKYSDTGGLPFIEADFGIEGDYEAYMCIMPGKALGSIYYDHGSRLLEGNVRAFLSARGKINKGIRKTIHTEPARFFAYNNGIACTAKSITFTDDNARIRRIEDLQIINGGQTTASLTSAMIKDKVSLAKIFVPMKLTIVKSEDYDDLIQNISRYANSQNKVSDADLFSNHPFHRRFEKLATNNPAPAKYGSTHATYWTYERTRGKYEQSQFKLKNKTEMDAFQRKYPKDQVIKKEELAKYVMAGHYMQPHTVSKGAAKNMNEFAIKMDSEWKRDLTQFGNQFFKNSISYAILFRTTDKIIQKSPWYTSGLNKLNIIPYTIAKIISSIPSEYMINLIRIWKEQELYPSLVEEVKRISEMANTFLQSSEGMITTEYAKREETWKKFRAMPYRPSNSFMDDLIDRAYVESLIRADEKEEGGEKTISIETTIYDLARSEGGNYWQRLIEEGRKRTSITPTEYEIINNYICELAKDSPKRFPTQAQYRVAWNYRKKMEDQGVIV